MCEPVAYPIKSRRGILRTLNESIAKARIHLDLIGRVIRVLKKFDPTQWNQGTWSFLAILSLILDFWSGPLIHFPVLYLVPILFVSWTGGTNRGLALGLFMALTRLGFELVWEKPWGMAETMISLGVHLSVFSIIAILAGRVAFQNRLLETEVQALEGLLPICSHCKKIRNDQDKWEAIESYVAERSDATFSHSICPDCLNKHYPEYAESIEGSIH